MSSPVPAPANPFQALIDATKGDLARLHDVYETHRTRRNAQQKALLLADGGGIVVDDILAQLESDPTYTDPRNSLVIWARPPRAVRDIVQQIQAKLRALAPHLWLMPVDDLHITALEIAHSLPAPAIRALVARLGPAADDIARFPAETPPRLVRPQLSMDPSAVALQFLPADDGRESYHALRCALWERLRAAGVDIVSRYVAPSAHVTLARFVTRADHDSADKMRRWVAGIEDVNEWLRREWWDRVWWDVGVGKGLILRQGRVWYGGGETVAEG
ncbi:hypothetical protein AURDEDRAFT_102401, partial [Auricularia subglabra TFB-10046 SS5]